MYRSFDTGGVAGIIWNKDRVLQQGSRHATECNKMLPSEQTAAGPDQRNILCLQPLDKQIRQIAKYAHS